MRALVPLSHTASRARGAIDPVGLSWLVTVRWTTLLACAGAMVAGQSALEGAVRVPIAIGLLLAAAVSNLWLTWRVRTSRRSALVTAAGGLICADVFLLSWILLRSGGVLNPASVFLLVQIVVAALVLGRTWTWIVTALSVLGYAALFLTPTAELRSAQIMHPEIALHMRGMWLAFALTALIIAVLVTRLAIAIEQRDRALDDLRDRTARATRAAGLATLATGAAHELSTPLGTIAVAAHELERTLARLGDPALRQDAQLIRTEVTRCRHILDQMAGRSGEAIGETPRDTSLNDVVAAVRARLGPGEAERLLFKGPGHLRVVWPVQVIARAICNVVQNAFQASPADGTVRVEAAGMPDGLVRMAVMDQGTGLSPEHLGRAGEPFFTTKPPDLGTGLGLFVARSSVDQLGGALTLSSTFGQGTTVVLTLPANVLEAESAHVG